MGWKNKYGTIAHRVNHANHFVPRPVQLNVVRQNVNSARPNVNTGRVNVNSVRHHVNSIRTNVNTGRSKQPVPTCNSNSFSPGNWGTPVKISAGYNWRNSRPNSNCDSGPTFIRTMNAKGPQGRAKPVQDFEEFNGGSVIFGGSKGYITDKGRIRVGNLDFDSVSFVKELGHFNLFSISKICDKQHKVLFTETECLVVSSDFKMLDENQILLKVPRHHNMYSFDMNTPTPAKGFACSSTGTLEDNPKILAFRRELEEIAQKHSGTVPENNSTSTLSINSGSEPVNTGELDPDDSAMPELEIFHKPETGIFDEASYDEEGVVTDFNSLPIVIEVSPTPTLRIHNIHPKNVYMLIERKYPLSTDVCKAMLDKKLQGGKPDEDCYKLLKMMEKIAGAKGLTSPEKVEEDKDDKSTKKTGKRRKQIARKGFHTHHDKDETEDSDEANKKDDSTSGTKIPINPIPVATKAPSIANYKIIKQGRKGVYQIVRENGTDMVYISFGAMLNDISRDDLTELYRIVMRKHGMNEPEDEFEKVLWEYLRNMFEEPLSTDSIWSLPGQQRIICWRYYDACRVHCLNLEFVDVYMLIERKYPLSGEVCKAMLDKKLQGGKPDEDCYKLLKMMEKQAGIRK
ncbi:hypothetical protein Tco_1328089 [Tanacetum coccineum]